MKNSKLSPQKKSGHVKNIFLSLAGLFLLFFASCSKDNSLSLSSDQPESGARKAILPGRSYETIKINHEANLTLSPDYSVTINTNGLVTYEGRAYVRVKGKIQFDISREMLKKLDNIFALSIIQDAQLVSQARLGNPAIPEHVIVTTTYFNGKDPAKIWIDNNTGFPIDVVARRKKVEQLLGISKYVKADTEVAFEAKAADL
ncbi:MAG: DUF6438 domain-containing protein [Bacteroidota bacterium]